MVNVCSLAKAIGVKMCAMPLEETAKISDMTLEEDPEICIFKTRELLSKAQVLMKDIEELLGLCTLKCASNQRRCRPVCLEALIQQEWCQASIEEDGETLVIEGFRFESAASREDLRRLSSQAGALRDASVTHD